MKRLRYLVPVFGIFALVVLFFKLPEAPNLFGFFGCKACASSDPYWSLLGAGYFAIIVVVAWLFPAFPSLAYARAGFIWAVLFAGVLTYSNLPNWCIACLIGHGCNILIWLIWMLVPGYKNSISSRRERFCLVLLAPISVIALFSSLNLTFMAYEIPTSSKVAATHLQIGDVVPTFTVQTVTGFTISSTESFPLKNVIINFVSLDCSHCKEQMLVLNTAATQISETYRIINVSPKLPQDLAQYSSTIEWVEDKQGALGELFNVLGYPTLFMIGANGKVARIIPGVSEQLQADLMANLAEPKSG